jgi:hypothetical protein
MKDTHYVEPPAPLPEIKAAVNDHEWFLAVYKKFKSNETPVKRFETKKDKLASMSGLGSRNSFRLTTQFAFVAKRDKVKGEDILLAAERNEKDHLATVLEMCGLYPSQQE